jgi:hypothetical protein
MRKMTTERKISLQEYMAEAEKLFGTDKMKWKFVCPSCGYIASAEDYKNAGAPEGAVGFSCIGRWLPGKVRDAFTGGPGPCNYAGDGLINISPVGIYRSDIKEECNYYFELALQNPGEFTPKK